jgi:hypothetical protein
MAILVVIVGTLTTVFTQSEKAWTFGTNAAECNVAARGALELMAHDLQYAVADEVLTFMLRSDRDESSYMGFTNDEINVVSVQHDSSGDAPRAVREIFYYVKEDAATGRPTLRRGYYGKQIEDDPDKHCYHRWRWFDELDRPPTQPILENVTALSFHVVTNDASGVEHPSRYYFSYDPHYEVRHVPGSSGTVTNILTRNRLPKYVDICLEVVPEQAARRIEDLEVRNPVRAEQLLENSRLRYARRVHFHNRAGYYDTERE